MTSVSILRIFILWTVPPPCTHLILPPEPRLSPYPHILSPCPLPSHVIPTYPYPVSALPHPYTIHVATPTPPIFPYPFPSTRIPNYIALPSSSINTIAQNCYYCWEVWLVEVFNSCNFVNLERCVPERHVTQTTQHSTEKVQALFLDIGNSGYFLLTPGDLPHDLLSDIFRYWKPGFLLLQLLVPESLFRLRKF